jgi:hypothetical protein
LIILRHAPTQIAIGEHADQSSPVIDDADAAGFGAAHDEEGIADAETLAGDGLRSPVRMISRTARSNARPMAPEGW